MMEKTLPEVCIIQYGFPFDSSKFCSAEGVPLVRIRDVVRGYSETYTTEIAGENYIVNDGDLLIGMDGEFNIAYWKGGRAYLNQRVCRLIPREDVDRDYIFYYMPQALKAIEDATPFVTVKHLSAKQLSKILIPLPDMSEQQRISAVLRSVDRVIAMRKKELDELTNLVKSRFIELFGNYDLTHPQESWAPIKEVGTVVGGATPKTDHDEYWGGSYRWITPAELDADSGYIYDSVRKLTKAGVESCSLQEMPVGTVILSSRAPIGKVAIAGNTFYCNQGFKNIICKEGITPRYLYTVLLLNVEYLNSLGRGATFKEISKGIVESIRIPVPSMELQEQFAAFVEQTDKSKYYSSLSFRYCQAAANTYRQEWMTCRTSDF